MTKTECVKLNELQIEGYVDDYVFETIKKNGDFYEKGILEKWTPYIKESKVVLDIGANLGNHTLYWGTEIPKCKIYAFEPYLPTFNLLKNNVTVNELGNVTLYNKGVGKKKTFAYVSHVDEKNMGATTLEYNDDCDGIEVVDIDSLVQENEIKDVIDFVKIDTEGFEVDVLKGMELVLQSMHPDIWVEVGADTCNEVFDKLEQTGYCAVDIEGANVLFLSKERHGQIEPVGQSTIIQKMLYYYQRTNDYYGLYNTVKENYSIVREKNNALTENYERLKEWYSDEQQKNALLTENYDRMKGWNENSLNKIQEQQQKIQKQQERIQNQQDRLQTQQNRIQEQNEAYDRIKQWRENDQQKLIDVIKAEHQQMLIMQKAKKTIQKQQTEIQILRAENEAYKQKLSVIYDTWYGKIAMKCYNFLKKIKRKLVK